MKASKKLLRTQDEIIREEREVSIDIILKALLGRGRGNGLRGSRMELKENMPFNPPPWHHDN